MKIITVENVDLIYKTNESITAKKIFNLLVQKNNTIIKNYKALNNISFSIEKGKVYGIIGDNGAGKSTLLRVLSGVYSPNNGRVERKTRSISLLALGTGFSKELTGRENIYLNAMMLGFNKKTIEGKINEIIEFSELGGFIDRPMKTYSSGMVSRLGFSIAIHLKPEVLLIDEILSVGDVNFKEKSFNAIKEVIKDESVTVLIVSHSAGQIKELCDEAIWLDKGNLVAMGKADEIMERYLNHKKVVDDEKEYFTVENQEMAIDLSSYDFEFLGEEKTFKGNLSDKIKILNFNDSVVKITKRSIDNGDYYIFFEINKPANSVISINIDDIDSKIDFSDYYERPPYDKRYGNNTVSGPMYYLDLKKGSMIVSKIYYYSEMEKRYTDGKSVIHNLNEENNDIQIIGNQVVINACNKAEKLSFFILQSKEKLFENKLNLEEYFKYYFDGIKHNAVFNSYFILPDGTYTKLPHSIEPSSKNGYGFSLHHSSNKDLAPFLRNTNERYFYDMILGNIMGIFMYQPQKNGIFYTHYTSTWLKKDTKITAPYIDTRLNETFINALDDFSNILTEHNIPNNLNNFVDFLIEYKKNNKNLYRSENGIMFPDYFKDNENFLTHASLNHQLGIANLCYKSFAANNNRDCFDIFESIINFVSDTYDCWINKKSGDIYYGIKIKGFEIVMFGKDYVYVTLMDLIFANINYFNHYGKRNEKFDILINKKMDYLDKAGYSIFDENSGIPLGEQIDSREKALWYYTQLQNLK